MPNVCNILGIIVLLRQSGTGPQDLGTIQVVEPVSQSRAVLSDDPFVAFKIHLPRVVMKHPLG